MTAIREEATTNLQNGQTPLGRTFAMTLVSAGYGVLTVGLAYLVTRFMGAPDDSEVAALVPVFATITAVVGGVGLLSLIWSGARCRSWFWLTSVLPPLLILLGNATFIAYDIIRPANTGGFLVSVLVLAGGLTIIVGGVTAFLEIRRGRPKWTPTDSIGWVYMAVVGVVMGGIITSFLAGSASAGGTGVTEEPDVARVLTIEENTFVEAGLELRDGEVLGLFIVNKDPFPHSFDVEELDIHVQIPADSTTAVAIEPTGPESLEFFCGVPGHRQAGMVGTIEVEA